ncbi:MAG: pyruvate formate-lyase-activating protein [Oscillospiraceae bacterium]|nr:pyruvate formate-lyase-activating protein [Oscillospiraceae bacterium]
MTRKHETPFFPPLSAGERKASILYDKDISGYVHSVETAGMVDGPGIRYVVFFSGCNLRCKYCHNPDTWKLRDGRLVTVGELIRDIKKYRSYLHFSGGGVTITGGEPLLQWDFLLELLKACRSLGIHTALDTAGYTPADVARETLPYTDLLMLDIKSINPAVYQDLTGGRLGPTLEVLRIAREIGLPVWIRYVLVPGLTDDEEDIQALAAYLRDFPNVEKIEVLPFHKLGEYKWAELGLTYELADVQPPTQAAVDRAREILSI